MVVGQVTPRNEHNGHGLEFVGVEGVYVRPIHYCNQHEHHHHETSPKLGFLVLLTRIGPLISSKLSTATTSPFCIISTSPAFRFAHNVCRILSMASLHVDAFKVSNSEADNARAISEGQIVLGQALVLSRWSAWRKMAPRWASFSDIDALIADIARVARIPWLLQTRSLRFRTQPNEADSVLVLRCDLYARSLVGRSTTWSPPPCTVEPILGRQSAQSARSNKQNNSTNIFVSRAPLSLRTDTARGVLRLASCFAVCSWFLSCRTGYPTLSES